VYVGAEGGGGDSAAVDGGGVGSAATSGGSAGLDGTGSFPFLRLPAIT
jgi:hypothetical protein